MVTTDFDLKSSLLLANLYYDFRPYERFTPYVGVGVGAAHHSTSGGTHPHGLRCCDHNYSGDSNWSAAGAVMAGLQLPHRPRRPRPRQHQGRARVRDEPGRLHLDVGYRFLYLGDAHTGSIIGAVVRRRPARASTT